MSISDGGRMALLAGLVVLSGCAIGVDVGTTAGEFTGRAPGPGFPECESETFDFVGEGTLRGLGLDEATPVPPPEPDRVGMIWVTHERMPHDAGPPGGPVERFRMLCFEFPDGSGGSGWPVDPSWRPPSALGTGEGDAGDAGIAPAVVLAAAVIALLTGVSVVAFRRGS